MTGLLLPQQNLALASPSSSSWTRDRLQALIKSSFGQRRVVIVANRRPQPASQSEAGAAGGQPVSGLLSALIPLIEVSGGTWIGHDDNKNGLTAAQAKGKSNGNGNGNDQGNDQGNGHRNSQAIAGTSRPPTSSAMLKFKRKTTKAITTDFQTKACGPFATLPIPNRNSNQPIGMPIAASINTLPKPCLRKQRATRPSCSSRTTTSACLPDYSNKSSRTS